MIETAFEVEIFGFAQKHEWSFVHGSNGSKEYYWEKDGRYRMVSIEPKSYGWLIGMGNQLFVDIEDPATCILKQPAGKYHCPIQTNKTILEYWEPRYFTGVSLSVEFRNNNIALIFEEGLLWLSCPVL